ncbi:hypothetical protein [Fulvitalea axinellae]|uniref:hypothetical protein n=1 Tax=Fulvitalea axinellae TaxID=1182444 RepID=UPI0030CA4879
MTGGTFEYQDQGEEYLPADIPKCKASRSQKQVNEGASSVRVGVEWNTQSTGLND